MAGTGSGGRNFWKRVTQGKEKNAGDLEADMEGNRPMGQERGNKLATWQVGRVGLSLNGSWETAPEKKPKL